MSSKRYAYPVRTIFLLTSVAAVSYPRTLVVGKSGSACPDASYTTISAALSDALPYDTVAVCSGVYREQLPITKPVTLRGKAIETTYGPSNHVLVQPESLTDLANIQSVAAVTILNTTGVTIENIAIDASNNGLAGCAPSLSAVHFFNSAGRLIGDAISGARLLDPANCDPFFGNGFGVLIDTDGSHTGPLLVHLEGNSIHDFTRNGVYAIGSGVVADIVRNTIQGVGPSSGSLQFGIFIFNGAFGWVAENHISEGLCGSLSASDCLNLRSEGVVLRLAADGSSVDRNVIMNAQIGIFLNGGNGYRITRNSVSNIDIESGIHLQGHAPGATGSLTNVLVEGNTISNLNLATRACGIHEAPDNDVSDNRILNNLVNDAYCGVEHVSGDPVLGGRYINTLYEVLNVELPEPPPTEP